jgi:hypothetical protein
MSRTKKRGGSKSPITKYISFSGSTGTFKYWDKNKKENVELDEISIILLDTRASITGFNENLGVGITSNMVVNTNKEELKVVSFVNGKPNVLAEGLYADDVKPKLKNFGGKFTQNVICLADVGDGLEVVNLQLTGVALGSWIELVSNHPNDGLDDYLITLKRGVLSVREKGENVAVTPAQEKALDAKLKKNPRAHRPVWFYVLDSTLEDLTEEQVELAIEEDEKLQAYFESLAGNVSEKNNDVDTDSSPEEDEEPDDLPF